MAIEDDDKEGLVLAAYAPKSLDNGTEDELVSKTIFLSSFLSKTNERNFKINEELEQRLSESKNDEQNVDRVFQMLNQPLPLTIKRLKSNLTEFPRPVLCSIESEKCVSNLLKVSSKLRTNKFYKNVVFIFTFYFIPLISAQKCKNLFGKTKYDGECMEVRSCTGAALSGDCTASNLICCIADVKPSTFESSLLKKSTFLTTFGNTTRNNVIYHFLAESIQASKINNEYQLAAYLSQLVGETQTFEQLESKTNESDLDSSIGNSEPGDGSLYRGRGAIYLKGKKNYELAQTALKIDLVNNPEKAAFPSVAFKIAAWFWLNNVDLVSESSRPPIQGPINDLIDGTYLNFALLTNYFTLDSISFLNRLEINDMILVALNFRPLKKSRGLKCMLDGQQGYSVPICYANQKSFYCGCEGDFERKETCNYGLLKNGRCLNPSFVRCCVENYSNNIDLVIIMDNSGSIGPIDFQKEKEFVKTLIQKMEINMDKSRIAVVHFSSNATTVAYFNQTSNASDLTKKVESIPFTGGSTNTADALLLANNTILQEKNGMRSIREGIPKVVVVITDGKSNDRKKTLEAAQAIKDRGFSIITAGVGNVDQQECKLMSSTPYDFEYVNNFSGLNDILFNIASKSVLQPAPLLILIPIRSTISKNQYKYFKYPLGNLTKLTIQLDQLLGSSALFYSFVNPNPKDDSDVIALPGSRQKRETQQPVKYYTVSKSTNESSDTLYISVKGYDTLNSFEMKLSETTTTMSPITTTTKNPTTTTTTKNPTTTTTTKNPTTTTQTNGQAIFST
ncbi:unnamed protein product, partial [Brachionus calyciflorus]